MSKAVLGIDVLKDLMGVGAVVRSQSQIHGKYNHRKYSCRCKYNF